MYYFADYKTNRISSLNGSFWELHNPDLKDEKENESINKKSLQAWFLTVEDLVFFTTLCCPSEFETL